MKKNIIAIITVAVIILVLWFAARATHTFETFNIATTSNEPTYHPRDVIFASRFKKADYGSFVCFKEPNGGIWIFRCIAKEGDLVEIRDTKVFLNGKELNEPYTYNDYYITKNQLNSIQGYVDQYRYPVRPFSDSTGIITLSAKGLKNFQLDLKPFSATKGIVNKNMFGNFQLQNWNEDNLGPVKVPKDSYFLLGDNRHEAMDSRYLGFISKDDIVSTVIN